MYCDDVAPEDILNAVSFLVTKFGRAETSAKCKHRDIATMWISWNKFLFGHLSPSYYWVYRLWYLDYIATLLRLN